MRCCCSLVILFAVLAIDGWCAGITMDHLTVGSATYSKVTVLSASTTDAYISHSAGFANLKIRSLPKDLQAKLHYDPAAAKKAEKDQLSSDALYQDLVSNQMLKPARDGTKPGTHHQVPLLDPISDKSLVGRPAPPLSAAKWDKPLPALQGRLVVLCFLAQASDASRAAMPHLRQLRAALADQAVFLAVSAGTGMADRIAAEIPLAIDAEGSLTGAFGVSEVPSVAVIGIDGKLLYRGHPAALELDRMRGLATPEH